MLDRIIYWLAAALIGVIRRLPLPVCFVLGQGLGAFLWLILPAYRKLARENLAEALGCDRAKAGRMAFRHFTTLGANALSSFRVAALPPEKIARIATIERLDRIRENIAKGRGVVLAINHIGNWELYAQLVFQVPEARFGTVYQALRNKALDDLVNRDRRRLGVATFDRKKGFNAAIALLREPGIVGVLVDQNAGDGGIWMPFFGRLSSTSPLAATLAQRTDSAVIPVAIYTTGFARWRVVLSEEIPYSPDDPNRLTAAINTALEAQIRQSPPDWFWVHNRWKTPWPNFLTARQKRGTYLPPDSPPLRPFRIVVRSPNWLGDAVMSFRAARAFKHGRPDARLAVLAPAKLAALWRSLPEVDEVIAIEKSDSAFAVATKLRGRFDAAVLFPNSLRSALEVYLAGIPRRVGFRGHRRAHLLNQIIPEPKRKKKDPPLHHADRYWHIAERCGGEEPAPLPLPSAPVLAPGGKVVIGICSGAEYGPAKRWPAASFRQTMDLVSAQIPCSWVIVGTAADQPVAAEILAGFPGEAEDLTGRTSLDELIVRLRGFSVLLTNDTGTMHLADSLNVPLVALFGSTEPALTGPRSPRSIVLRHKVDCSPCFLRECPIDFPCMTGLPPEQAAHAILQLVRPPTPENTASATI